MIEALYDVLDLRGSLHSLVDFLLSSKQCFPTPAVSLSTYCIQISACACCFYIVHCVDCIHGSSSSATERLTLIVMK